MADVKPRIAVADDEPGIREALCYALEKAGYEPVAFPDGLSAWNSISAAMPDLAVLDIMMPCLDGIEVLKNIRRIDQSMPVIFLTSRDDEFDRVLGLELGADDYVCKPFSMRELLARIKILLRKSKAVAGQPGTEAKTGLFLSEETLFTAWNGTPVRLTVTEFRVLHALVRKEKAVLERDALLYAAYPDERFVGDRSIDCHIKRVRRKLEQAGAPVDLIETVYGLGYRYRYEKQA